MKNSISCLAIASLLSIYNPVHAEKTLHIPIKSNTNQAAHRINLNKATAKELSQSLKGIGKKRAEAIIKYRAEHGQFKTIDDLAKVKGFSNKFIEKNHSKLINTFLLD